MSVIGTHEDIAGNVFSRLLASSLVTQLIMASFVVVERLLYRAVFPDEFTALALGSSLLLMFQSVVFGASLYSSVMLGRSVKLSADRFSMSVCSSLIGIAGYSLPMILLLFLSGPALSQVMSADISLQSNILVFLFWAAPLAVLVPLFLVMINVLQISGRFVFAGLLCLATACALCAPILLALYWRSVFSDCIRTILLVQAVTLLFVVLGTALSHIGRVARLQSRRKLRRLAFYYVKACWPLALGTLQYALAAPLFLAVAGYFNRRAVDEISVLMALEGLMMVTGSALASATCTHTAILYSGRKVAQLLAFSQFVQVFVFAFSFVMAAFVLVALSIYVYMLDGALIKMELFVIWMCAFPLRTYNTVVILGLFRGFGSIRGPFILDFVSVWFFALPCLLILAYFDVEEVAVIYAVFLLDETKAIVLYVLLRRFIRRLGAPDKVIYP